MQLQGKAVRITIYIGENDHYQGKALYMALLELLKKEGASGATVVRGLAGFGAGSRIHTATVLTLSEDLPLRLEWVDQPELVERLLPQIRRMVDDGLITVEEVDVVQYAPGRTADPLAQPVHNVMRTEVTSVGSETPVEEIVSRLVERGPHCLPVVDASGRLVGLITDGDLLRRAGLMSRLSLQAELALSDWSRQLAELRRRPDTAADIMTQPVITVSADQELRQAVTLMVDKNLKRLPVTDASGRLVGWISRVDVLRSLEYHQPVLEETSEPLPAGTTIEELMYRDVPTVSAEMALEEVLQALEKSRRRRAVVIGGDRKVVGIITDGDLLRRSRPHLHPSLLSRLRTLVSGQPATDSPLLDASETAADLMTSPVHTIGAKAPLVEALRLMLQYQIKRLPVVDENGRLVGLLGRASLLRGLLTIGTS